MKFAAALAVLLTLAACGENVTAYNARQDHEQRIKALEQQAK